MIKSIPLSGIKKIEELAAHTQNCISLSQGALRAGGIPSQIKQHIQKLLDTTCTDYYGSSAGLYALREALAIYHSSEKTSIKPTQVLPTHGCIGALSLIFLALLKPDDEILIPEPAYPAYHTLSLAVGARPIFVPLEQGTQWKLSLDKIKEATTEKTKIIIFSNPWNPLGIVVPKKQIEELIDWCQEKGIYLIIDEAYRSYVFDHAQEEFVSSISQAVTYDHVISTHSFSKNFAMSGWRVGFVVAQSTIINHLITIQDALLNSLNNTAQYAALYAIQHPELIQEFRHLVQEHQKITAQALQPLIHKKIIQTTTPDGGFFYFLKVKQDPTELCMNLLTRAKVSLVPGPTFGPSGHNYLRLCFARDRAALEAGLDRFVHYMLKEAHV